MFIKRAEVSSGKRNLHDSAFHQRPKPVVTPAVTEGVVAEDQVDPMAVQRSMEAPSAITPQVINPLLHLHGNRVITRMLERKQEAEEELLEAGAPETPPVSKVDPEQLAWLEEAARSKPKQQK